MSRKVQIEYNCESCLYKCSNKRDFNKHLLTKKHLKNVENGINPKINSHIKYTCELCDYRCSNERDFNKHLLTKKHATNTEISINPGKILPKKNPLHTHSGGYKCTNCNYSCKYERDYNKHMSTNKHQRIAGNSGSDDNSTILYDISTSPPNVKHHFKHHTNRIKSIAFHQTLSLLATGSCDNSTILYDISTLPPTVTHHLNDHTCNVLSVVFHPSLPLLATGSADKSTILYDISTSPPIVKHYLKHHIDYVRSVAFHPSLPLLATCLWNKTAILYNLDNM